MSLPLILGGRRKRVCIRQLCLVPSMNTIECTSYCLTRVHTDRQRSPITGRVKVVHFESLQGYCRLTSWGSLAFVGADTQMLSEEQWTWLEAELARPAEVKLIGSGVQVLPPLAALSERAKLMYCAYDGVGGTFDTAISDLNEVRICLPFPPSHPPSPRWGILIFFAFGWRNYDCV